MTTCPDPVVADPDPIQFRVREPSDLLAIVPYLLGFHPTESVVIVLLNQRRLVLTARLDLAPVTDADWFAAHIEQLCAQTGASRWALVGYGESQHGRTVLTELAARDDPGLTEAIWVQDGRWWGLLCPGDCCPAEGNVLDLAGHPMVAEAVYAGLTVGADRSSIASVAAGPDEADLPRLRQRIQGVRRAIRGSSRRARQRRMDRLISSLVDGRRSPDEDQSLQLAVLSEDVMVRDIAFAAMTREQAHAHVAVWSAVVHRTPDELAAAPLCMLAVADWLTGSGALLNCCLERLDVVDPTYSMGEICRDISARAIPPSFWDVLGAELRNDPAVVPR